MCYTFNSHPETTIRVQMYQDKQFGHQFTETMLRDALTRLGDLLKSKGKRLELTCCGGVVSVLYHHSRQMTHDVDVVFPNDPAAVAILNELVETVGREMNLHHGPHDKWLNDGVSFMGLQTKSHTVIFQHSNLVLKAADWHEMLAHKLTAFRGERDIIDALSFLKEIPSQDRGEVFKKVSKYRPFVPHIADEQFMKRFNQIWERIHGK